MCPPNICFNDDTHIVKDVYEPNMNRCLFLYIATNIWCSGMDSYLKNSTLFIFNVHSCE